jgi:hypothetical protein
LYVWWLDSELYFVTKNELRLTDLELTTLQFNKEQIVVGENCPFRKFFKIKQGFMQRYKTFIKTRVV